MQDTVFDEIQAAGETGGVDSALSLLADRMLADKEFSLLFTARQMQIRHRLGVPIIDDGTVTDNLEEPVRTKLEDGYVDACREVGNLFLEAGRLSEAWHFLQIVGDQSAVREAIEKATPDEESLQELVELALYEGINPIRGLQWVLDNHGTCNTITTLESQMPRLSPDDQQRAAEMLVRHLHHELSENVRADIEQRSGAAPSETTLAALLEAHPTLLDDDNYHVDTTHLAATVRFARVLSDAEPLRLAIDLTAYGKRLGKQFQFEGDEPFADSYPSSQLYFSALLGEQIDQAVAFFGEQAQSIDIEEIGSAPAEYFIGLLDRLGRHEEALEACIDLIPADVHTMGLAPSLMELCRRAGRPDRLMEVCRDRGDLIGFSVGIIESAKGD